MQDMENGGHRGSHPEEEMIVQSDSQTYTQTVSTTQNTEILQESKNEG